MKAFNVMSSKVATVRPDARLEDAIRMMLEDGISGIPVTDAIGKLLGIVTEGDMLRRAEIGTAKEHKAGSASWFPMPGAHETISSLMRARSATS